MEVCNLPRGAGKTTYLIYRSHVIQYPIVCFSEEHKNYIMNMVNKMKIDIPEPITINDFNKRDLSKPKKVLVDEALYILKQMLGTDIDTVTLTEREINWL